MTSCTPTALAYGGQGARAVCTVGSNSLPFTGANLLFEVGFAICFILLGAALLRWATK